MPATKVRLPAGRGSFLNGFVDKSKTAERKGRQLLVLLYY